MIEVLLSISMLAESKKKEGGIGQFMIMNGSASFIQKDSMLTLPDCDLLWNCILEFTKKYINSFYPL